MIHWLSSWLDTTARIQKRTIPASSPILLKDFVDFDLDIVGLYAQGHYNQRDFLAAVKHREPHTRFSIEQIRWTWAKLEEQELTEFANPIPGTEPITLIEIY